MANIPPRASGGPTKGELKEMIQQAQTKEMLQTMADQFQKKLGNVIIATLQNFSPNIHVGMNALLNVLCSTASRSKIGLDELQALVAAEYAKAETAMKKLAEGTTTPEDPQVASVSDTGETKPVIELVKH